MINVWRRIFKTHIIVISLKRGLRLIYLKDEALVDTTIISWN